MFYVISNTIWLMKLRVGLLNNPFSIMYTVYDFSVSSIEHGNVKKSHIFEKSWNV